MLKVKTSIKVSTLFPAKAPTYTSMNVHFIPVANAAAAGVPCLH